MDENALELPVRMRALKRVRVLAGLSAALETLALMPGADALVVAAQWLGLKGGIPLALAALDALFEGRVPTAGELWAEGTWFGLLNAAFGPSGGGLALAVDGATDGLGLLPPPLDGFDVPPMIADGAICVAAHVALRRSSDAAEPAPQPPLGTPQAS